MDVRAVFGDAGHYLARQVQKPGIYGYRVYGTIDYFGVASLPIDTTVFCSSPDGDTSRFNSPEWHGSFGCTSDIKGSVFPGTPVRSTHSTAAEAQSEIVEATAQFDAPKSQSWDGTLLFGIPVATLAGMLGWKGLKRKGEGR